MLSTSITITVPPNSDMCGVELSGSNYIQSLGSAIDGLAIFDQIITTPGVYPAVVVEIAESITAPSTTTTAQTSFSPIEVGEKHDTLTLTSDGNPVESLGGDLAGVGILADKWLVIEYVATEGGYIEGLSTQTIREGFLTKEVTAVALPEYNFMRWSDGSTTPNRQDNKAGRFYAVFTSVATNKLILQQYRE